MKQTIKAALLLILAMVLTACNTSVPQPTETSIPTFTETSVPTSTSTPKQTLTPTETSIPPTETPPPFVFPTPSGKPLTEWNGIPVMSGAIAGEATNYGYAFIVNASLEEAQGYYEEEMVKLGWNMMASSQDSMGTTGLLFQKESETASVNITPQPGGLVYVLLNTLQIPPFP